MFVFIETLHSSPQSFPRIYSLSLSPKNKKSQQRHSMSSQSLDRPNFVVGAPQHVVVVADGTPANGEIEPGGIEPGGIEQGDIYEWDFVYKGKIYKVSRRSSFFCHVFFLKIRLDHFASLFV